jgi:hypothetical protein
MFLLPVSEGLGFAAYNAGAQMPEVPQMALKSCLWTLLPFAVVPQIAEFALEKSLRPQIKAVHTGIARLIAALFMPEVTIEFISDDRWFFMSFAFPFFMGIAFLLITVDHDGAVRNTGAPDYAGAPNHT